MNHQTTPTPDRRTRNINEALVSAYVGELAHSARPRRAAATAPRPVPATARVRGELAARRRRRVELAA